MSCLQVTVVISGRRDTYTHTLRELSLTVECSTVGYVPWWCTPISHLHAIPVSPHYLITKTINAYGTQWPALDIAIILVIAYRLVVNQFKNYAINSLLSIKVVLRTLSQYRSLLQDVILWWKKSNNFYYLSIHIYL